jgi:hypothetical protein
MPDFTGHGRGYRGPLEYRFWTKVEFGPSCWEWIGSRLPNGYGVFRIDGCTELAHRVAYELFEGVILGGLHIDHLCRNTACVNPSHLEPVTQSENNRRQGAAITHCVAGHEFSVANTYITRHGHRNCRTCHRLAEHSRRRREQQDFNDQEAREIDAREREFEDAVSTRAFYNG